MNPEYYKYLLKFYKKLESLRSTKVNESVWIGRNFNHVSAL